MGPSNPLRRDWLAVLLGVGRILALWLWLFGLKYFTARCTADNQQETIGPKSPFR
jgi:hypothetical protein